MNWKKHIDIYLSGSMQEKAVALFEAEMKNDSTFAQLVNERAEELNLIIDHSYGELDESDEKILNDKLSGKASLPEELELIQFIVNYLKEEQNRSRISPQIQDIIDSVDIDWDLSKSDTESVKNSLSVSRKKWIWWAGIAASILLVGTVLLLKRNSDIDHAKRIFTENFKAVGTMFVPEGVGDMGFIPEDGVSKEMEQAYQLYFDKQYPHAIDYFKQILAQDIKESFRVSTNFYLANALLATNHFHKAISLLEPLANCQSYPVICGHASWYLSLAYISNRDFSNARSTLKSLDSDNPHYTEALSILEDLP